MLNILASAKNIPVAVLENVNYQGRLAYGNKKNRTFVCNSFLNYMREIEPAKILSDIVMFDGALNMIFLEILLKVRYPKLTFMRCINHTV